MITKEQLIDIGAEKLAEIILSIYKKNEDIQRQLDITFAGFDSDPKRLISMIQEEIASLQYTDLNCYESDRLPAQVNEVRTRIKEDILPKSPDQAIELLLNLLDNHEDIIIQVKDYDYAVVDVFREACADLGQAFGYTTKSLDDVVDIVYNRFIDNGYEIYDNIIRDFKDILSDNGLSLLKQKLEKSFNKNKTSVKQGLIDIADCQNDVDDYIKACNLSGKPDAKEHLEIAKRLIKHCRGIEAKQWLDSMDSWSRRQDEHEALKIQALDLYSDYKAAQTERLNWFETTLNPKAYSEILKNAEKDFIESFKKTAIGTALKFPDPLVSLTFLKEIQEFEEAAKLVRLKCHTLDAEHSSLHPIADALYNIDPLAATLLYRRMIQPVLRDIYSWSYYYNDADAANYLVTCHSLSFKITDWQEFQNHQLYFEEVSRQNPYVALICLIKIQEFELAAKLVRLKFETLNGRKHKLRPIADALCKIDPLAATLLYRQMIQPVLNSSKIKYYAADLAMCHSLSSKITDWQEYQSHQLYFQKVSKQLKRKRIFWNKFTSAINKWPKM